MENTIKYYVKNVYGKELIYLVDEQQANIVRTLTGQKTVSDNHLHALVALGCSIEEVMPPKQSKAIEQLATLGR